MPPSPSPPPAEAPCAGYAGLEEFRAALNRSEDRFQAALRALESLTPGGSEFAGDIEACVAHVRHRYRSQHETLLAFGRRVQAAEAREARLRAALIAACYWGHKEGCGGDLRCSSCQWLPYLAQPSALAEARRGG